MGTRDKSRIGIGEGGRGGVASNAAEVSETGCPTRNAVDDYDGFKVS